MKTVTEILAVPCKPSSSARDAEGYCKVSINGKRVYQHRVAYCAAHKLKLSDIDHLKIVQMCGRHNCINPEHLTAVIRPSHNYTMLS